MLLDDFSRVISELAKQAAPAHDPATSTAFHH
jgi:hypothetical protein